ncbi:MAG: 16S rRNA (guanine(966)-N(2))-methyltransferase RsmD [Candidatus Krumholzibacteria bacterium]|jgi:16S rRNA (guanine966-N2)-methyltransferase|nr:16S rRNA (guanine(966)-N(2))-methyltransferase RsmD [Candidatus Krumholzibacteria bacterium]MDP6796581.1 16S rRNA (guanine(966)-N(2))-methyltransferase RsmD [Candidatus Krumholzibacteria bacterium]MDP7020755.1 16S rRNA (guanine(966)-N(2))-methyltransferase RsmD [Candidatus Krumholzibacteria bacterium]
MRVIAGRFKGRRLFVPPKGVRPTSDRVRESLFSVLGGVLQGKRVLDLFAGSGSLGIEAMSRGAVEATFVDRSRTSMNALERNLAPLKSPQIEVRLYQKRASAYVVNDWAGEDYDLVFLDPPYGDPDGDLCLKRIVELRSGQFGKLVFEASSRDLPPVPEGLEIERQLEFGDTTVLILSEGGKP